MQQAYLIAQFRRAETDRDSRECTLIAIDLLGEAYSSIISNTRFFFLVVARGVGRDFEDACRDAIQNCAADPCLEWMLEWIVPRSRQYLPEVHK